MPRGISSLTLADARQIIAAAERAAPELGVSYNIAVIDAGGNLIAHARMDGAWADSLDISLHKAWTDGASDMATQELGQIAQAGQSWFAIKGAHLDKVVIFAGGIPIRSADQVIGGIDAGARALEGERRRPAAHR